MFEISRLFREFMDLEKRRMAKEFHPKLTDEHADQRRSVRVPTLLRVSFPNRRSLEQSLLTNISRGGVFVATQSPEPIGAALRIAIRIEGVATDLVVDCVVVAENFRDGMAGDARGMALAFENPDAATRARLDALYEEKLFEAAANIHVGRNLKRTGK